MEEDVTFEGSVLEAEGIRDMFNGNVADTSVIGAFGSTRFEA